MAIQGDSGSGQRTMMSMASASRQPFASLVGFARSSFLGSISLVLLTLLLLVGLFPHLVAPYDPDQLFYVDLK